MFRTDEQLVTGCREGDESAWEVIILRHQRFLHSIPRRAGLSPDLAADILQDVFTALFQKIESLEQPQFLRAWLVSTTRHKTLQLIYREKRGNPKFIDDDEDDPAFNIADGKPLADDELVRIEREEQIEQALAKIDERCRRLLSMLYLENEQVPYAEVAGILDIPLGSIGPTRARCLKKLVKLLPE